MSFDYSEFKKYADGMKRKEQDWDKFVRKFFYEMGLRMLRKTKEKHTEPATKAYKTGHMRNNWFLRGVRRNGDVLEIVLYNNVDYASYVEDGHMTRNREDWIEGKHMAKITIEEVEKEMPARFEEAFRAWIQTL